MDSDAPSPNARLLRGQSILPTNIVDVSSGLPLLDISSTPFTTLLSISVHFDPDAPSPFGFELATCPHLRRVYIASIIRPPSDYTL